MKLRKLLEEYLIELLRDTNDESSGLLLAWDNATTIAFADARGKPSGSVAAATDAAPESPPDHNAARLHYAGRRGFVAGLLVFTVFFILDYNAGSWNGEPHNELRVQFLSHLLAVVVFSVATFCAWAFARPSLLLMRVCEKCCLAAAVFFLSAYQWAELTSYLAFVKDTNVDALVAGMPFTQRGLLEAVNDSFSLRWGIALFTYVLFVPRPTFTQQASVFPPILRTVATVCFIGAVPLILTTVFCSRHDVLEVAVALNMESFIWICAAAVPAIYGQFVVEATLRGERILGAWGNLQKLGKGGMGTVYLAQHRAYSQPVAMKFIRLNKNNPGMLKRFRREALAMAELSHPHLVRIYHFDPGFYDNPYIVMEFVRGITLERVLRRLTAHKGRMQPSHVVYILRQVASALCEIHAHSMIHRDISLKNVMLSRCAGIDDFVKVLDLGVVKSRTQQQETDIDAARSLAGLPGNMAPEQMRGDKDQDHRVDIYLLGLLACRMLAGNLLDGAKLVAQAMQRQSLDTLLMSGCPQDVVDVVVKCTQTNRDDRYATAQELIGALDRVACANEWTRTKASVWWTTFSAPTAE